MSETDFEDYKPLTVFGTESGLRVVAGRTGPTRNVSLQPSSVSVTGAASAPVTNPQPVEIPVIPGPPGRPGPPGPPGPPGTPGGEFTEELVARIEALEQQVQSLESLWDNVTSRSLSVCIGGESQQVIFLTVNA